MIIILSIVWVLLSKLFWGVFSRTKVYMVTSLLYGLIASYFLWYAMEVNEDIFLMVGGALFTVSFALLASFFTYINTNDTSV